MRYRSRKRHLVAGDGQPIGVAIGLLLEGAVEDALDVGQTEGAYGRARNGIRRRRERGVDHVDAFAVVKALERTGHRFCFPMETKKIRVGPVASFT